MININNASRRLLTLSSHLMFSISKKYKFSYAHHMIPHPAKAYKGGQDAIFASDNFLVVADGVGGWADHGVDPGLYSKKLCKIIGEKINQQFDHYINDPQQLLIDSWKLNKEIGSTTVCMMGLHPETGKIKAYYLGDSVYGIFKKQSIQMAQEQQKSFNFPFQVGSEGDHPKNGVFHQFQPSYFNEDDYIVLGTDGVWDNIQPLEVHRFLVNENSLEEIASSIAKNAHKLSLNEKHESPFYKRAKQAGYRLEKGGKPDDISVIVAKILVQ